MVGMTRKGLVFIFIEFCMNFSTTVVIVNEDDSGNSIRHMIDCSISSDVECVDNVDDISDHLLVLYDHKRFMPGPDYIVLCSMNDHSRPRILQNDVAFDDEIFHRISSLTYKTKQRFVEQLRDNNTFVNISRSDGAAIVNCLKKELIKYNVDNYESILPPVFNRLSTLSKALALAAKHHSHVYMQRLREYLKYADLSSFANDESSPVLRKRFSDMLQACPIEEDTRWQLYEKIKNVVFFRNIDDIINRPAVDFLREFNTRTANTFDTTMRKEEILRQLISNINNVTAVFGTDEDERANYETTGSAYKTEFELLDKYDAFYAMFPKEIRENPTAETFRKTMHKLKLYAALKKIAPDLDDNLDERLGMKQRRFYEMLTAKIGNEALDRHENDRDKLHSIMAVKEKQFYNTVRANVTTGDWNKFMKTHDIRHLFEVTGNLSLNVLIFTIILIVIVMHGILFIKPK